RDVMRADANRVRPVGNGLGSPAGGKLDRLADYDAGAALGHGSRIDGGIRKHLCADEIVRFLVDLGGRPELRDAALVQGCRVSAEQKRLHWFRRCIHNNAAASRKESRELVTQLFAKLVVEIGERLI